MNADLIGSNHILIIGKRSLSTDRLSNDINQILWQPLRAIG